MKILFWLYILTTAPFMFTFSHGVEMTPQSVLNWIVTAIWGVTLVGFYAMAYGKRIGSRAFWKVTLVVGLLAACHQAWLILQMVIEVMATDPRVAEMSSGSITVLWVFMAVIVLPLAVWIIFTPSAALALYLFRRPALWAGSPARLEQVAG